MGTCLRKLTALHSRVCPRQVLGVRMGLWAAELLQLELPRDDKRLLALVETDGCFADGVSVASGCWFGRRTMRLVDHGKVAATLTDTLTHRAVRMWPHPLARTRALSYDATGVASPWTAQLHGYQVMPLEDLLCSEQVSLALSLDDVLGRPGVRVTCVACGEEVLNGREVLTIEGPLCRCCAGERYFIPTLARQSAALS